MSSLSNERLKILQSEYWRVTDAIALREARVFRVLLFGFPIIGGGLATAVRFDVLVAITLVPLLIEILGLYWVQTSRDITVWGGYGRHLEERVNDIIGSPCLGWEVIAHRHLQMNAGGIALGVFVIGVWGVSVFLGVEAAGERWNGWAVALLLGLVIVGLVAIIQVAVGFKSSWKKAYDTAKKMDVSHAE